MSASTRAIPSSTHSAGSGARSPRNVKRWCINCYSGEALLERIMGPLASYLPYLLNRAGARIAAAFGEEMRPLGASLQIWRVLAALREKDGRRMGDLSNTTSIEVSTLTRLVDNMEKNGLVARRRDAADTRAVLL